MKKVFLLVLFSFLAVMQTGHSESVINGAKYRLFGGYSFIGQSTDVDSIPGLASVFPDFSDNNSGKGFFCGLSYELPLPYHLYIGLKISSCFFSTEMKTIETGNVLFDNASTSGTIEKRMKSDFTALKFNSYLKYYVVDGLAINFGGYFAPLLSQKYSYSESIKSPIGATFSDNLISHEEKNISFPGKKGVTSGIDFGISYDIPLNKSKTFFVTPGLDYFSGLNDVFDFANWTISSVDVSLSFTYSPNAKKEKEIVYDIKCHNDTIVVERPDILYAEFHEGITDTSNITKETADSIFKTCVVNRTDTLYKKTSQRICFSLSTDSIRLSPHFVTNVFKSLNRIYYSTDPDSLLDIYLLSNDSSRSAADIMMVHRQILPILAEQMQTSPRSVIKLQSSSADSNLSGKRLATIKQILVNNGVSANRILLEKAGSNIAVSATNAEDEEENNFVEITSDNQKILASKEYNFKEFDPMPQLLSILTSCSKIYSPKDISILISQSGKIISQKNLDSLPENYVIDNGLFFNNFTSSVDFSKPLEITLSAKFNNGEIVTETKNVNLVSAIPDSIYRLSLMYFDFAEANIPDDRRREINEFLAKVPENADVKIFGYSDNTGSLEFNKSLSLRRANNVKEIILAIRPDLHIVCTEGYGYEKFPPGITSYSLAPERILSRTVILEIVK